MEINYLKLYPNLARVYSLTCAFYCTARLVSNQPRMQATINEIYNKLGWDIPDSDEHTDMVIELPMSELNQIINAGTPTAGDETVASIKKEWDKRRKVFGRIDEDMLPELKLEAAYKSLLRAAVIRLELTPIQVESIIAVARIIAYNDESAEVRLEHLAEAIQYQSI